MTWLCPRSIGRRSPRGCCTALYYFKCCSDCKGKKSDLFIYIIGKPRALSPPNPWEPLRSLLTFTSALSLPSMQKLSQQPPFCASHPSLHMSRAAPAATQPAGREHCRVQSWGRGKNEQLGKPSVQNSGCTSLDPNFWTVAVVLEVLQELWCGEWGFLCVFFFCLFFLMKHSASLYM